MHPTKTILLYAAIGLAVAAAGCGARNTASPTATVSSPTPASSAASKPAASAPAEKHAEIQAFFSSADGSKLVPKKTGIHYIKDDEKYLAALEALKKSPAQDLSSLCPNMTFHSVRFEKGTLTMDISFPDSDRWGSSGEGLLLEALKKTLFQFEEVQAIEILVHGQKVESLMGHFELQHPIKR